MSLVKLFIGQNVQVLKYYVAFRADRYFVDIVMLFDAGNAVMSIITFFVTLCILISMSFSLHMIRGLGGCLPAGLQSWARPGSWADVYSLSCSACY